LAATAFGQVTTRITMERKGCPMDFTCPAYKVTIAGDGSVLFEGKQRVSAMGTHKKTIQIASVQELAKKFESIQYFSLPRHLGSCTDAPLVVTSVTVGSRSNEVSNWECGTTLSLSALENEVDQVSNSKVWIRGRLRLWFHWPWFHSQS
jgi:Domain of unknown function (DUF6438)